MNKLVTLVCLLVVSAALFGQELPTQKDTVTVLNEVVVHAYANDRSLAEVPAAIGYVDAKSLERFNNTSVLPAMNAIPGVRMEERSPGSYRFAIRGSSLRSPFGVRNVKMYWNGLPLTDGSGNTYLNLIDFNSISNAEVIKGPGASLYGAGTGGVVLLNSPTVKQPQLQFFAMGGSFGLQRYQASAQTGSDKAKLSLNFAHQQSDGYREHTNMRRDAINADVRYMLGKKGTLTASLFYTDLYYQTPGGLKKAQYDADPKQARPTEASPGAVDQQAAVYNKTFFSGLMHDYQWSDHWSTRVGLYGAVTDFTNPALRNYEIRKENNFGGRAETQYQFEKATWKGKLTLGAEYQHFFSTLADYGNVLGVRDTLQTYDHLAADQMLIFAQAEFDLPKGFFLTIGGSGNFLNYDMKRISVVPGVDQHRNFNPVVSPRLALVKKISDHISAYGNISQGFSPPSLAEVRPSTGNFNNTLNPEHGTSYEVGLRGTLWGQLSFDVAAYDLKLDQTIVVQQQNGADYFINAGKTDQKGIEMMISWSPKTPGKSAQPLRLWSSYAVNHYRFVEYVENTNDYSGNKLTGVAPNVWTGGIDARIVGNFYANITLNYVDKIPLNDGNTEYSTAYFLEGMRISYRGLIRHTSPLEIFGGVDNASNQRYSLGNDLNATGARYYNTAAGRNFYFGMKINWRKKAALTGLN